MKTKQFIIPLLICVSNVVACNSQTNKTPYIYEKENLHYQSSDQKMETFLNDLTHRLLRYDEDAIGDVKISHTTGFAKNWDVMGISWHNNRDDIYLEDRYSNISSHLKTINQDELGMIYNTHNGRDDYFVEAGQVCHQGWPFPSWKNAATSFLDLGYSNALLSMSFEFNGNRQEDSNWTSENGDFKIKASNGYANFSCENKETFRFYKTDIEKVLTSHKGIHTECAPFVEMDFEFKGTNIDDYYIIYKTQAGGDTWFKSAQKTYATNRKTDFTEYADRQYLSLYLDSNWDKQVITDIGIEFVAKEGTTMTIKDGLINYMRPNYDTRQSNATLQWLLALNNYISYTHDMTLLKQIMPKARRAMLFLLDTLDGKNGLVDVSYLYGHNGVGLEQDEDGNYTVMDPVNGIANGWWDVSVNSEISLEPNIYFYEALLGMASLEDMVKNNNITITEKSKIRNKDLNKDEYVYYNYTSEYLRNLANTVKQRVEQPVNPVFQQNGWYKNEGGFYYPKTGRFVNGINEKTGAIHDYGNIPFNEQAICVGFGTEEQQKSIMNWIDGKRIISTDRSQGDDIYFFEFAPRCNTKDCTAGFNFTGPIVWKQLYEGLDLFNIQVQAGGAALVFSYYDLVARAKVLGAENAYKRLNEISKWYNTILESQYHGYGSEFFNDYYMYLEAKNTMAHPEQENLYILQNSQRDGAGTLGLDGEFLENVIFTKAIPDSFTGFKTNDLTLMLDHNYDNDGYMQIDNCSFANNTYSLYVDNNSIAVNNVKGVVDSNQVISFTYKTTKSNPLVYLDGRLLKGNEFTFENNLITVTTNFKNHTLKVK